MTRRLVVVSLVVENKSTNLNNDDIVNTRTSNLARRSHSRSKEFETAHFLFFFFLNSSGLLTCQECGDSPLYITEREHVSQLHPHLQVRLNVGINRDACSLSPYFSVSPKGGVGVQTVLLLLLVGLFGKEFLFAESHDFVMLRRCLVRQRLAYNQQFLLFPSAILFSLPSKCRSKKITINAVIELWQTRNHFTSAATTFAYYAQHKVKMQHSRQGEVST